MRPNVRLFLTFAFAANACILPAGAFAGTLHATLAAPSGALAAGVPELSGVRDLGRAPQALPVSLAVTLAYRHDAELQQLIAQQSDPASRYYHEYLSNAEFAEYFGPTAAAQGNVIASLERAGFSVTSTFPNRTVIDVVAPASVVAHYFETQFDRVEQPNVGTRYANVRPAMLPAELRGTVSAVTGFTDVIYAHTSMQTLNPQQKAAAAARNEMLFGTNSKSLAGTYLKGFRTPAVSAEADRPLATTSNEVRDPGFESGQFGSWLACNEFSASDPSIAKTKAHAGSYSSLAGSTSTGEINLDAGVCESVTIPTNGELTFWVYQYSNEPNTSNAFQEADLVDSTGKRVVNFYASVKTTTAWTQLKYNVSAYAGGRYFLYFGVQGNGNKTHKTYQYVDDVSLTGSAYPVKGTKIGGAALGPDNGYGPVVVADAYDFPVQHNYDGAGRATGVEISGDYSDDDLYGYLSYFGITRGGSTTRVEVDGGAKFTSGAASSEATLDVETIVGLAPSTQLYMYLFPDLSDKHIEDGYNKAVSDNVVDVVNSSFGGCETADPSAVTAINKIVAQAASKGITFSASSGDNGSAACNPKGVESPASEPNVVAVGGTSLYVNNDASYNSEAAWSGSGGGVSSQWALPSYQSGIKNIVGKTRNVPDIAFPADPNTGTSFLFNGNWSGPTGGTSWASPIFSALLTETDERRNSRAGYFNPTIYSTYTKYGSTVFHDVTKGSNGAYSAHSGYDNVTGLGSLKAYTFSGDE